MAIGIFGAGGGGGGIAGPVSSTAGDLPQFSDTTGQVLTDSGVAVSSVATLTGTQTLTNKTLTAPIVSTISNSGTVTIPTGTDTLVARTTTDTLTNKTLTAPIIATISNSGTVTLPTGTRTLVARDTTDTLTNKTLTSPVISTIVNTGTLTLPTATDTLVARTTTDTLTNKTLTAPVISTIVNTGTLTLPTSTDTLVGKATTDTLTNKTVGTWAFNNTTGEVIATPSGTYAALRQSGDAKSVQVGGSSAGSTANGAMLTLNGVSATNPGSVYLESGTDGGGTGIIHIVSKAVANTSNTKAVALETLSSGSPVSSWYFTGQGHIKYINTYTSGGSGISDNFIEAGSTSGNDTYSLSVCGGGRDNSASAGGGGDQSRGAYVQVCGVDHTSKAGKLYLFSGSASNNNHIYMNVGHASAVLIQQIAGTDTCILGQTYQNLILNGITRTETSAAVTTSNGSTTVLYSLTLADNTTYEIDALVVGRLSSTTAKGFTGSVRAGAYRNNGGGATLVASANGAESLLYGASGYSIGVDVTGNLFRITIVGAAAETVHWAANIRYTSVS